MRQPLRFAVTALALATVALPARAQNFLTGSVDTIQPGNLRLIGAPTHMFGRDGRPDRTGGAFRLGYGLSDSFGVEGKAAFFDGVTLVGGDGHFRLLDGATNRVARRRRTPGRDVERAGLDRARPRRPVRTRLERRLDLYAGTSFSYEFVDGATGSDFTRVYLVPGLRYALGDRAFLVIEAGVGFNHDSPHYVAAGLAWRVPVSASARARDRR